MKEPSIEQRRTIHCDRSNLGHELDRNRLADRAGPGHCFGLLSHSVGSDFIAIRFGCHGSAHRAQQVALRNFAIFMSIQPEFCGAI